MVGNSVTVVLGGVVGGVARGTRVGARIMYIDTFFPLPSSSLMQRLVYLANNIIPSLFRVPESPVCTQHSWGVITHHPAIPLSSRRPAVLPSSHCPPVVPHPPIIPPSSHCPPFSRHPAVLLPSSHCPACPLGCSPSLLPSSHYNESIRKLKKRQIMLRQSQSCSTKPIYRNQYQMMY